MVRATRAGGHARLANIRDGGFIVVGIDEVPGRFVRSGLTEAQRSCVGQRIDLKMVQNGGVMRVSVTEAKAQLTELVRRAEAGDEVILTRHGHPAARLVGVRRSPSRKARRALLEEVRASGATNARPGPSAARSHDHLYGESGLPE